MQAGVRDPQIWGHRNHEYDFQLAIAVPRVPVEGCYEDLALRPCPASLPLLWLPGTA